MPGSATPPAGICTFPPGRAIVSRLVNSIGSAIKAPSLLCIFRAALQMAKQERRRFSALLCRALSEVFEEHFVTHLRDCARRIRAAVVAVCRACVEPYGRRMATKSDRREGGSLPRTAALARSTLSAGCRMPHVNYLRQTHQDVTLASLHADPGFAAGAPKAEQFRERVV